MDQLITSQTKPTIDSREVAEMMGIKHHEILRKLEGAKDRKGYIGVLGDNQMVVTDYFIKSAYTTEQNKEMPCYKFTKMGCEFIANKFTGEKGILFTAKYVNRFNEMQNELQQQNLYKLPKTYSEALRELADRTEEVEILQLESNQQKQIIGELKPKADYVDSILKNKGLVTITQIAKDYGMTAQQMNELLHGLKIQFKQSGQWLLYREHHNKGYTHSETINITRSDGRPDIKMRTKWTQKGRLFIYDTLKQKGTLPLIEQDLPSKLSKKSA